MRVLFHPKLVALSKPRCGSTSLRRMLTPLMRPGDLKADAGDEAPPLHPHITAPYLRKILNEWGHDAEALTYIITIRHPVSLLWSYWKFFKPDAAGLYSFSKGWAGKAEMPFEEWVLKGRLQINPKWLALAPDWISPTNLTPLNLESRAMRRDGTWAVDHIFKLEEPEKFSDFLTERLGVKVSTPHLNASESSPMPQLGSEALERVRKLFPYEAREYNI